MTFDEWLEQTPEDERGTLCLADAWNAAIAAKNTGSTFEEYYGVGHDSIAATDARDAWNAAIAAGRERLEMATCRTCKHWQTVEYISEHLDNAGDWKICMRLSTSFDDLRELRVERPAEAIAFSESQGGELITRSDFGCTEYASTSKQ